MLIGEAARARGVSADTIRHYERRGVIPPAERDAGGYRRYSPAVIDRVRIIRRALSLGRRASDATEQKLGSGKPTFACWCHDARRRLRPRFPCELPEDALGLSRRGDAGLLEKDAPALEDHARRLRGVPPRGKRAHEKAVSRFAERVET